MLRGSGTPSSSSPAPPRTIPAVAEGGTDGGSEELDVFMTDGEITQRSQIVKTRAMSVEKEKRFEIKETTVREWPIEKDHFDKWQSWVKSLPETKPTNVFGDFRFDVEAVMAAVEGK